MMFEVTNPIVVGTILILVGAAQILAGAMSPRVRAIPVRVLPEAVRRGKA